MNSLDRLSRRDFLRHACVGVGALTLPGCATSNSHPAPGSPQPRFDVYADLGSLLSEDAFRQIAGAALDASKAETLFISLNHKLRDITRFADDRSLIHEHEKSRKLTFILGNPGEPLRKLTIDELTPDAAAAAVRAVERGDGRPFDAQAEHLVPDLPPQRYLVLPTYRLDTATADDARRVTEAQSVMKEMISLGIKYAGSIETTRCIAAVANRQGLFAYEPRTLAEMRLSAGNTKYMLPIAAAHRSINDLETLETIRRWTPALGALVPVEPLSAGTYEIIFGPEATAQLALHLIQAGKSEKCSPAPALTIRNNPEHPALLGCGFQRDGSATDALPFVQNGVFTQNCEQNQNDAVGTTQSREAASLALSIDAANPSASNLTELLQSVERGLFVAHIPKPNHQSAESLWNEDMKSVNFVIVDGQFYGVANESCICVRPEDLSYCRVCTPPMPATISPFTAAESTDSRALIKSLAPALIAGNYMISIA